MNKEKIILCFIAVAIGLGVASLGYYLYQGTKVLPIEKQKTVSIANAPSPAPSVPLSLDEPKDENVYTTRIIKVSGKTNPDAIIVVLTDTDQDVLAPAKDGSFSTTVTIDAGENTIQVTAVGKNGDSNTVNRTVTYSTESF